MNMGGMGPMQHSLTTATPFISQRIIFKARALGSNLICDTRISGCRLIWTINACRGKCFKSLRKNKIPHNVNSCDKCSCTAGGNGYRNHMFKGTGTGTV